MAFSKGLGCSLLYGHTEFGICHVGDSRLPVIDDFGHSFCNQCFCPNLPRVSSASCLDQPVLFSSSSRGNGTRQLLQELLVEPKFSSRPVLITFISDRHGVSLLKSDILYVESRDSEVWIHTKDGRRFRNKTPISQWENLLGEGFIRIHRAFFVAGEAISEHLGDVVRIGEQEISVSRKYYERVSSRYGNSR